MQSGPHLFLFMYPAYKYSVFERIIKAFFAQ